MRRRATWRDLAPHAASGAMDLVGDPSSVLAEGCAVFDQSWTHLGRPLERVPPPDGPPARPSVRVPDRPTACTTDRRPDPAREVDEARTLKGALLEKRIGDLRKALGEDKEVSYIAKKDMLVELDNLKVGQVKAGKEAAKEMEKKARQSGEELSEEAKACAGDAFVGVVDCGAGSDDGKCVGIAMDIVAKAAPEKAIFLASSAGGKLAVLALVPKALIGKMSAKAWTSKALDNVGGKGGGKDDRAQGQCPDPSKLEEALAAARAYP